MFENNNRITERKLRIVIENENFFNELTEMQKFLFLLLKIPITFTSKENDN